MASQDGLPSDANHVYFKSGDRIQSRPILTGENAKATFDSIPTIDASQIFSEDLQTRKHLAEEIGRAAKDVGFFYLINPPVSADKMDAAFHALARFFALPEDTKMKYHVNNSPAAKGYTPVNPNDKRPGFGGARETFGMGNDYTNVEQHAIKVAPPGAVPLNQWPDEELPEFRQSVYSYFTEVYVFAKKLVQIFSLALGLEETALDQFFEAPFTDITINHYPPQPDETEYKPVLYPHADYGAFTLLAQKKIGGLEVLNANAIWVKVPVIEHAFVVNTGSYFELISGGRWRSTIHRVCAKGNTDRTSLPFFFSPSPTTTIYPMVPAENESLKGVQKDIGKEHIRGMMADRSTHPFVKKLKALGLSREDYTYEMVSQPIA
jgi:isopenicillin N synthase-like dioxygenase